MEVTRTDIKRNEDSYALVNSLGSVLFKWNDGEELSEGGGQG